METIVLSDVYTERDEFNSGDVAMETIVLSDVSTERDEFNSGDVAMETVVLSDGFDCSVRSQFTRRQYVTDHFPLFLSQKSLTTINRQMLHLSSI